MRLYRLIDRVDGFKVLTRLVNGKWELVGNSHGKGEDISAALGKLQKLHGYNKTTNLGPVSRHEIDAFETYWIEA